VQGAAFALNAQLLRSHRSGASAACACAAALGVHFLVSSHLRMRHQQHGRPLCHDGPHGHGDHPLMTGLSKVKCSPKWSMSSRQKQMDQPMGPGPGTYVEASLPECTSRMIKPPKFSFGSATREESGKHRSPGPGDYNSRNYVGGDGPGFSCTPRREHGSSLGAASPRTVRNPGPGAHNLPDLTGAGPKFSATPRRIDGVTNRAAPGPGNYQMDDQLSTEGQPKYSFGSSTRTGINGKCDPTPGPGAYGTVSGNRGPKFTMRAKPCGNKTQQSPGPGSHGGHFSQFGY